MSVQAANYALRACNLKDDVARHVLTALAWRTKKETPHLVFMKNEDIREDTGLTSVNGVKNAISRLVAAGEVRVIDVGGRLKKRGALACDFELVGVRQWIEASEPERREWRGPFAEEAKVSRGDDELSRRDSKVSCGDGMVSRGDSKLSWRDTHRQDSLIDSAEDRGKIATNTGSLTSFVTENQGRQPSTRETNNIGANSESDINLAPARRLPTGIAARNATGEVKAALEARVNQLAAMHCDDDDAWFAMLRAEPQFSDISVDAVAKKMSEKTGGIVRDRLVRWLFTEDRTKLPKTSRLPVRPSDAERRMMDCERRRERMLKDEQEMKEAFAAAATADIIAFEPQRAAVGG